MVFPSCRGQLVEVIVLEGASPFTRQTRLVVTAD